MESDVDGWARARPKRMFLWIALLAAAAITVIATQVLPPGRDDVRSEAVTVLRGIEYHDTAQLDVLRPESEGPWPVLITLHGCCGGREDLFRLAYALAANGLLVMNTGWQPMTQRGTYPTVYDQAACAVRFARERADEFGGDPQRVALLGWSDGALLGAAVALRETDSGPDCPYGGSNRPDAFIGVAGFYGWADPVAAVSNSSSEADVFFGGSPDEVGYAWWAGNPHSHVTAADPGQFLLLVGDEDPLAPNAACFHLALSTAGHSSRLVTINGAGHLDLIVPRNVPGRFVVDEVISAAADGLLIEPGGDAACP